MCICVHSTIGADEVNINTTVFFFVFILPTVAVIIIVVAVIFIILCRSSVISYHMFRLNVELYVL